MKLDFVKKREEWVSLGLISLTIALGVLVLMKISGYYVSQAKAGTTVATAIKEGQPDAADTRNRLAKIQQTASALMSRNSFSPEVQPTNPVTEVAGILGGEVLIGNRWYKEGDQVSDAKIVKIEPTRVIVEWQGQTKILAPITSGQGWGESRSNRGSSRGGSSNNRNTQSPQPTVTTQQSAVVPTVSTDRFAGGGDMRERWQNMSDSERQAMRDRMRAQFGGDRGGFGGRGGMGGGFGGGGFGGNTRGGRGGRGGR